MDISEELTQYPLSHNWILYSEYNEVRGDWQKKKKKMQLLSTAPCEWHDGNLSESSSPLHITFAHGKHSQTAVTF